MRARWTRGPWYYTSVTICWWTTNQLPYSTIHPNRRRTRRVIIISTIKRITMRTYHLISKDIHGNRIQRAKAGIISLVMVHLSVLAICLTLHTLICTTLYFRALSQPAQPPLPLPYTYIATVRNVTRPSLANTYMHSVKRIPRKPAVKWIILR